MNPNETPIELGSQASVLFAILIRTLAVVFMCATVAAIVALLPIIGTLVPIVTIFSGFLVFRAVYRVKINQENATTAYVSGWNHLILIGACLLGGAWCATLLLGICYGNLVLEIPGLTQLPINCSGFEFNPEQFVTLAVVAALGFILVPVIHLVTYYLSG